MNARPGERDAKPFFTLSTSRYAAWAEIAAAGAVPVRISVGRPRFALPYPLIYEIPEAAPTWSMLQLDDVDFDRRYLARLDAIGITRFQHRFAAIARASGATTLALLCFENVSSAGETCHRRTFAAWWTANTGQEVPELGLAGTPDRTRTASPASNGSAER